MTQGLNLDAVGIIAEENGKIKVNEFDQTKVSNIHAVGDSIYG